MLRLKGIFLMVGALGVGTIGLYLLSKLAEALQKSPDHADKIAPAGFFVIRYRWSLAILVAPTLVAGLILLINPAPGRWRWPVFILGMLWILLLFGAILSAFIMFMAPLYQYQEL